MTKIKSYPIDNNVTGADKWIGTDSNTSNSTKNFTPDTLMDYYNKSEKIDLSNTVRFLYDTVHPGDNRKSGSFSFPVEIGDSVLFSDISNLIFSYKSKSGTDVSNLMTSMIGSKIIVQKSDDPNIFSYYRLDSFDQRISDPEFYDASVTYISGNGSIDADKDYLVSLLQFDSLSDTDKHYAHNQSVSSSTWNVQHNLSKFPSVTVVLSTGQKGYGDVTYIDENNLTITFGGAESGKAYMN